MTTTTYTAPGNSLAMTRIGTQQYPLRSEPRCAVCNSPHRIWIEAELVRGSSYAAVHRELAGMPHGPRKVASQEAISNHLKRGHMPLGQEVQRQIIARRAQELGHSVEEGTMPLADHVTVARLMVQKGMQGLADGTMPLNAGDTLKAAAFLRQVERESGGEDDSAIYAEALMVYLDIAKKFIPVDKQSAYARALHASPILRGLYERQQKQAADYDEDDIEDAEIEYAIEPAEPENVEPQKGSPPPEDW